MNPLYRVQIDVCLRKPVEAENIWLRKMVNLPFVPHEGDTIRIESNDEESTLDIVFESVVYDMSSQQFEVDIIDESLIQNFSESGRTRDSEILELYLPFDFQRVNTPVAQVVRA